MKTGHRQAPEKPIDLSSRLALTVSETGRMLGISGASVRHLIRTGRLRGISFGTGKQSKSFIVSVDSLRKFLAGDGQPETVR